MGYGCPGCYAKADQERAKREMDQVQGAISDGSGDGPPAKKLKPDDGDSDSDDDEPLSARIDRLMKLKNGAIAKTKKPDDGDSDSDDDDREVANGWKLRDFKKFKEQCCIELSKCFEETDK